MTHSYRFHHPPVRHSIPTVVGTLSAHGKAGVFTLSFYNHVVGSDAIDAVSDSATPHVDMYTSCDGSDESSS
ncbi:hypothetical protein [Haloquadratum walsbyi]|uniref:Uncharacterized protein n=1 Tax=Haloquadratum walsbyi J07HQW2 TaxID=1238425 RepID=U1N0C3_9EURY|nr:hypothetical protein [Haloquadratum walsbyi]ERG96244.1 MAG: hypothetical protein J07HQW2_02719 [Haloquadratum walsbyi J07HQW2]